MSYAELGPALACGLKGGPRDISATIELVLGSDGIAGLSRLRTPETVELIGLALNEVLHSVHEFSGEQTEADESRVELWLEPTILIVTVCFRGKSLPDWLLANWDRCREPAVLTPPGECGWGWLLVREALDSVTHSWSGSQQILFLERRL
ncbi:MAG: hypothetical protein AB8B85_14010, partial [Paracoccaceae bacterium]